MTTPRCHLCCEPLTVAHGSVLDPQTRETFEIHRCEKCGLGHTHPQPKDLAPYYGSTYHGNRHGLTAAYCAGRRVRLVNSLTPTPPADRRLLDIGCGDGTFLLAARNRGWEVTGTEMNPRLATAAGLKVYESVAELPESARYDCITMWHSLEHIREPLDLIRTLEPLLKPSGFLVIAVPDAGGLQAATFKSKWFHLDVPRHLYHFTRDSLTRLLHKANLKVKRSWSQEFEYDLFGWSQSALNSVMPEPNVFFNNLTGKPIKNGRALSMANLVLGAAFTCLAVPAVALGTLAGRGGTIILAAQRNGELPSPQ